jgi:predicted enzyme related to lactoylglutathione lyase
MTEPRGFTWFELQTNNLDDAVDFYTEVLQWGTEEWVGEDQKKPYVMFKAGDTTVGGVMELNDQGREHGSPPHWLGFITTDHIDNQLEQVVQLGGQARTGVIDIGEHGKFAVVADPHGATFALHEMPQTEDETQQSGLPDQDRPGAISWCELMAGDLDEAWSFYAELFDWDQGTRMAMEGDRAYQVVGWEGRDRGGIGPKPDPKMPACWQFYVTVEDLDAASERVSAHGGKVLFGPMEVPGGDRVSICRDPEGIMFALRSRTGTGMIG